MAKLIVQMEGGTPVVHELGGSGVVTIGREPGNTICIVDASVSRRHAEIVSREGVSTFRDLDSANGSMVNYELTTSAALKDGDIVHLGTVQTTFVADPPPKVVVEPRTVAVVEPKPEVVAKPKPETVVAPKPETVVEPTPKAVFKPKPEAVVEPKKAVDPGPPVTKVEPKPEAVARGPGVAKRRVLVGGVILALAVLALAAWLGRGPLGGMMKRRPPEVVITPEQKAKATKAFWDEIQRIELAGNQRGRSIPLRQYPVLGGDMFDFDHIDNDHLESLRENLLGRAEDATRVATELAALNPRGVDADLLTYARDLSGQWQSAADLDSAQANLAAAAAEQRLRYMTADASVMKSLGVATGDNRTEREQREARDRLAKMAAGWSAQRSEHLTLTRKTLASEKEINELLTRRYPVEFK